MAIPAYACRVLGHQAGFVVTLLAPPDLATLKAVAGVIHVEALSATRFKILHNIEASTAEALLTLSAQQGWQAQQLTPLQGNLEDAFVQITQNDQTKQIDQMNKIKPDLMP